MKKSFVVLSSLALIILFLTKCVDQVETFNDSRGKHHAGAAACRQCHQAIYDSFLNTAHFNATSAVKSGNIAGNFKTPNNIFVYDSLLKVVMEKRDSGYYQVLYQNGNEKEAYPFDIVFGIRNAQTFLYWKNDQPFELPLSWYSSVNEWATSPGFSATHANFNRFIGTDCFECHSSGINSKLNASVKGIQQVMQKETMLYGIDCERCHGPALDHVNFHLENPHVKTAAFLVKNSKLTPQQKLDACAVCHSGNDKMKLESRFKFKMGDTLSHFFMQLTRSNTTDFDVHGNQYNLLAKSKCFRSTNTLNCSTCHNPHESMSEDLAVYSQKCMNCHKPETHNFCPEFFSLGESIKSNCIDCHMPKQASKAIRFQLQGSELQSAYLLRTHDIAVYRKKSIEK